RTAGPPGQWPFRAVTLSIGPRSGCVTLGAAGLGLGGLDLPVLRRRGGPQLGEQLRRRRGDGVERPLKRLPVGLRRLVEAADLADVLERRGADLLVGGGGIEVVERSDVSAHASSVTMRRLGAGGALARGAFTGENVPRAGSWLEVRSIVTAIRG